MRFHRDLTQRIVMHAWEQRWPEQACFSIQSFPSRFRRSAPEETRRRRRPALANKLTALIR